jgi:hypothetical protein
MPEEHDQAPKPQPDKPLYLMQGSPLVAGGKARLMSNRKVKPKRAEPREVTGPEEKGYTEEVRRALRDEPETPSRAWVDAQGELAAMYDRLRLQKEVGEARATRQALSIEHRMADAHRRAKLKRIDLTGEFHVMRKMLERGNQATATERMERVEARLDGWPLADAA